MNALPITALDIDGTLADYGHGDPPKINLPFISKLQAIGGAFALVSNQGGLPFGEREILRPDGRPYPRPGNCASRLWEVYLAMLDANLSVVSIRYCVFHPKADPAAIQVAARNLRCFMAWYERHGINCCVYTTARARKPSPLMLRSVGAVSFYGDSDEDERAAAAAEIPFYRVERFQ